MAQTSLTGMNQTNRSLRLAPPPPPPPPRGEGCLFGGLLFLCLMGGLIGVGIVLAENTAPQLAGVGLFVACAAGFTGLLIVANKNSRIRKAAHAQQIARWRQAIANWERLYYCSRNDIVFIPGNPETSLPAHELYKLL